MTLIEDEFSGSGMDADDGAVTTEFRDGREPLRLPAIQKPVKVGAFQSSDPRLVTCVHEIARALEEFAVKEYVPLFNTTAEFENAALEIVEKLHVERCPLKS